MSDVEVVEASTELVPAQPVIDVLVRPAALDAVVANQKAYLALCEALLDASDYQKVNDGAFKKKSAWRKLNVAFNVSVELVSVEETRDERDRLIRAKVVSRAVAPNGRQQDGIGVCDVHERHQVTGSYRCPPECDGFKHFSHPEHDILATAHTRATNRASSDLYGMGEVSAEEVDGKREAQVDGQALLDPWMTADVKPGLKAWREAKRYPVPSRMTLAQVGEALVEVGRIRERIERPPCGDDEPAADEVDEP